MADFPGYLAPAVPALIELGNDTDVRGYISSPVACLLGTPGFAAGGGGSAPVVTFVSPLPGTPIIPSQPITVDVTDVDLDDVLTILSASFPSIGLDEVVRRGAAFTPRYAASSASPIANGFRYVLRRSGGWPAEVQINADVVDASGNVG